MLILFIIGTPISFLSGFYLGKWLFSTEKEPKKEDLDGFYIEHYPLTSRFYPKYRRHYLRKPYPLGVICVEDELEFGVSFNNQKHAEAFIERAKEHLFNKGVQTIKYIK